MTGSISCLKVQLQARLQASRPEKDWADPSTGSGQVEEVFAGGCYGMGEIGKVYLL